MDSVRSTWIIFLKSKTGKINNDGYREDDWLSKGGELREITNALTWLAAQATAADPEGKLQRS